MKAKLFKDMMSGFNEAMKYRRGEKARPRVARFSSVSPVLKPKEIRKVRTTLGLSQRDLTRYLGAPGARQGMVPLIKFHPRRPS